MVLDPCKGTGTAAKASLEQIQNSKITGTDSDGACVEKIVPFLLETIEIKILNEELEIVISAVVEHSEQLYLPNWRSAQRALTIVAWTPFKILPPLQSFPSHVMQFSFQYYRYIDLHNQS